jgi:hypothetical protein
MSETETVWHVQVEGEGVKIWSLDQLDAAYKAGLVDDETFVFEDGGSEWQTLGALLNGEGEGEGDGEEPEPPPVRESAAPQSFAAPSYAPQSLAPQAFTPQSFAPSSPMPQSTAPMVSDIDDFEAPAQFRSKKRGFAIAGAVALVACGVAVLGLKLGTTATEPPPVAAVAPPVEAPAPPPPVAAPLVNPAEAAAAAAQRLNDDQRKALLEADKAREAKLDAKHKARAASAVGHHKSKEKGPFQNGGDKYDPLNAKL